MVEPRFQAENTRTLPIVREATGRAGRWEYCFELATGGMATVYLAYAAGPMGVGKLAAVKVIQPHLAKEREYVEMFLDEARIASMIQHPNVCATYEFGQAGRTYYIAMEYLHGEPLGALRRALSERSDDTLARDRSLLMARIVADAAEGLHAAHELRDPATGQFLNVVHRDVSPQNVFVTYDGAVRIVDFGIARAAGRIHNTTPGIVKGKFAYMAPEQMRGREIDRRADVWSLGVILWEMIALTRLFQRKTDAATARAVTREPIPKLSDVCADAPAALVRVVSRALERDPERRYATAREMANDLTAYLGEVGRPMGLAEVSVWMRTAFSRRCEQKSEMMRMAIARGRQSADGGAAPAEPITNIETLAISTETDDDRATVIAVPVARSRSRPTFTRPMMLRLAAVAGVAMVGGGLLGIATRQRTEPAAGSTASTAEPAAETAPRAEPAEIGVDAGHAAGRDASRSLDAAVAVESDEPSDESSAARERRHRRREEEAALHRGAVLTVSGTEAPSPEVGAEGGSPVPTEPTSEGGVTP